MGGAVAVHHDHDSYLRGHADIRHPAKPDVGGTVGIEKNDVQTKMQGVS